MYDAFISYSRSDLAAVAGLKRQLDKRGLHVFLDIDSLRAGEDWPPQLGRAIQKSRMMVLCWSTQAAVSDWVKAEFKHSLSSPVPVLPWLLDSTPLPPMLQKTQGIRGTDPAAVVKVIADKRRRYNRRVVVTWVACALILFAVSWLSLRAFNRQSMAFHGHVVDQQGNAVAGVAIEAGGVRADTSTSGEFALLLAASPPGRTLRVTAWKPGYRKRTVDTQSDVPDLGVVLERER